jgi:hypothetical protein
MMTFIYWLVVAALLGLSGWCLYREDKLMAQLTCALVAIPLILRLVLMK